MTSKNGTKVWSATHDPFGKATVNEDPDGNAKKVVLNVRFPGQYFDAETGLHYNYFRTYDPGTGRYLESDPIGLDGGLNTYGYAFGNPIKHFDREGLKVEFICRPVSGATRYSHCFVHVTCPNENIDVTLSLFGRFPWIASSGYKSMATPSTYINDPGYPDNPNSPDNDYSDSITPSGACDCEYEKDVINKFNRLPNDSPYFGFSYNSNSFAEHLITSPRYGTSLPANAPLNAPGFLTR